MDLSQQSPVKRRGNQNLGRMAERISTPRPQQKSCQSSRYLLPARVDGVHTRLNEGLERLPADIEFETIVHDLGVLTFAVTLPQGMGDKELQKWAQTSFTLIDTTKGPLKEPLSNLIWLVTGKMELAITTMQAHVKNVQAELMPSFEKPYNDYSIIEVINSRYKDHAKRGDILADLFSNFRKKLRARFGDAEKSLKVKHKEDLKLQAESEEEPEVPEPDMVREMGSMRLASEAFRD
ncbi:hypothetical protein BKA65DRAFT_556316 [Rhexocercosporidium sp. MPI-PUGE-AT-0058]|nr:hypothetical protein BKA65DRAFT_556316 [Rhexocercosporidium sp. MPI-PUGE-AT-0058]